MLPFIYLLTTNVPHHIAHKLTGFYMMGNIGCQWVKSLLTRVLFSFQAYLGEGKYLAT